MSTEVAIRSSEVPASFAEQMHMATVLADSTLLPAHLRGKPANVLLILQGARALDVSAFWALQSMHVVEGKLGLSAELMRALVNKAGHQFTVIERTAQRAVVEIQRKDKEQPYRAEFTAADAQQAGLLGKDNWKKYLKSMLVARATSIAVRDECPEVMFGMVYTPEELGAETDRDGRPIYQDGRVVMEGQIVAPVTKEQIDGWAEALSTGPLEALPAVWEAVAQRVAAHETPTDADRYGDASLLDVLTDRLSLAADKARCRPDVRELFNVAKLCRVLDAEIPVGEIPNVRMTTVREYIVARGSAVPEECPSEPEESPEGPAGGEGEGDPAPEPQERAERAEEINTPTAEALRAAAAESWAEDGETAQTPVGELARQQAIARHEGGTLAWDGPTEGEADADRAASPDAPVLIGEVMEAGR